MLTDDDAGLLADETKHWSPRVQGEALMAEIRLSVATKLITKILYDNFKHSRFVFCRFLNLINNSINLTSQISIVL